MYKPKTYCSPDVFVYGTEGIVTNTHCPGFKIGDMTVFVQDQDPGMTLLKLRATIDETLRRATGRDYAHEAAWQLWYGPEAGLQ